MDILKTYKVKIGNIFKNIANLLKIPIKHHKSSGTTKKYLREVDQFAMFYRIIHLYTGNRSLVSLSLVFVV